MRILCSTYEYPPIGGGGGRVARPLAAALAARGHTVDVVTTGMADLPAFESDAGVDVHRVRCRRAHAHFTTTAELATWLRPAWRKSLELVRARGYDVNHTHFALPTGLVSWRLFRKTGLPYVITIHGSDVPGYNPDRFGIAHRLVQPLWRRIVAESARIVSPSGYLEALLKSRIDVPVEVIPNGMEIGAPSDVPKRDAILVVTRMFPRKGVQHFLEALEGLPQHWDVTIAGDGPHLDALERQARRSGLRVDFRGTVQSDELAALYASSRIFVFPSLRENFPTVLLEAMQAGCAIITTTAEGCREVMGDAGIAVEPGRPDRIREALARLMSDRALTAALGELARTRVREFAWPRIAASYESVLANAARGDGR